MELHESRHILLCLRWGIGDVVMELPALGALRAAAPTARITVLGAEPAVTLLEGDPRVDALETVQRFGFRHWGDEGDAAARVSFAKWRNEQSFDAVLDASHAVRGIGTALYAVPAPFMGDSLRDYENAALLHGYRAGDAVAMAIRRGWGVDISPFSALSLTDGERNKAAELLASLGLRSPIAVLSPIASTVLKQWPVDRLAEVGAWLHERGYTLAVLSSPDGEDPVLKHAVTFPPLSLRRIAAVFERSDLFVGNDTGMMHLAAAAGTNVVAIFGPTSPRIYAPRGSIAVGGRDGRCRCRRECEFGPPECVTEGRCRRGGNACMEDTAVDEVVETIACGLQGAFSCPPRIVS